MLFFGLHLPFRWYDDVLKQNRYLPQCERNCDFELITTECRMLPFMIKTTGVFPLSSWELISEDGTTTIDITADLPLITLKTLSGSDYIIYPGGDLSSPIPCGKWYSVLTDGVSSFYSELFTVKTTGDANFVEQDFELHLPWRWYDNLLKQNKYKPQCERNCDFYLISPQTSLPPFMFRRETIPNAIASWTLEQVEGICSVSLDTSLISIITIGDYDYIYYEGDAIDLDCGYFYSVISDGVNTFYSERIHIMSGLTDSSFILQESGYRVLQENTSGLLIE